MKVSNNCIQLLSSNSKDDIKFGLFKLLIAISKEDNNRVDTENSEDNNKEN